MDDPFSRKLVPGCQGTVKHVDDMGTIHVSWDCGSSLGVAYGEDVCKVVGHPRSMICTDSPARGSQQRYHPRLIASFPRAIAKYVRELSVVSLTEMIRKMTSLPAHVYGLENKGTIGVGMDADICIFDAEKITDRADFLNCSAKNEGIYYVLVNGKIVLEKGQYNGTCAAKVYTKV